MFGGGGEVVAGAGRELKVVGGGWWVVGDGFAGLAKVLVNFETKKLPRMIWMIQAKKIHTFTGQHSLSHCTFESGRTHPITTGLAFGGSTA